VTAGRPADGAPTGGTSGARGRCWVEGDAVHIDVRGLRPPAPMVAIVELVQKVGPASHVVVHHERDPRMLYPELAELGWEAVRIDGDPGEVRLRLERIP
jgi:hypothetical protein